jgi:non-specific serine/threonine protein kinase
MESASFALILTPHGHLTLSSEPGAPDLDSAVAARVGPAFDRGAGHGLLQLGAGEAGTALPPVYSWWREFGSRYVSALCAQPDLELPGSQMRVPAPSAEEWERLVRSAPPMTVAEYLTSAELSAQLRRDCLRDD